MSSFPSKPSPKSAGAAARGSAAQGVNGAKGGPLERLLGAEVRVGLRSGESLEGRYVGTSRYEIELLTHDGRIVVFKHAIDWVRPAR